MGKRERQPAARDTGSGIELNPQLPEDMGQEPGASGQEPSAAAPEKPPTAFQQAKAEKAQMAAEIRAVSNRQDEPPPDCPACRVRCISKASDEFHTRYYCPNGVNCPTQFSIKLLRPLARKMLAGRRKPDEPFAAR